MAAVSLGAQQPIEVSISEPGRYTLAELFKAADTVALVRIDSGDAEHYEIAVYKGDVIKAFKGTENGATLVFGPYVGLKLGTEYLLFLRRPSNDLAPKSNSTSQFGTVRPYRIFNEGYSSMEKSYQCNFSGKEIHEQCQDAIRVCTDYIVIPEKLETVPARTEETPFGCRWTRNSQLESLLEEIAHSLGNEFPKAGNR